ncbi:hypothetical protein TNCT_400841 [Trichonephila clavata]|uniref:Uncharacterized protein n=1 Tax=Trichonephila clavata TaxID=2740835 RepID=A0A8X6J103_TRICU|nr:hypothetical protein TNCT_400841 [Trichonephila clavata]
MAKKKIKSPPCVNLSCRKYDCKMRPEELHTSPRKNKACIYRSWIFPFNCWGKDVLNIQENETRLRGNHVNNALVLDVKNACWYLSDNCTNSHSFRKELGTPSIASNTCKRCPVTTVIKRGKSITSAHKEKNFLLKSFQNIFELRREVESV